MRRATPDVGPSKTAWRSRRAATRPPRATWRTRGGSWRTSRRRPSAASLSPRGLPLSRLEDCLSLASRAASLSPRGLPLTSGCPRTERGRCACHSGCRARRPSDRGARPRADARHMWPIAETAQQRALVIRGLVETRSVLARHGPRSHERGSTRSALGRARPFCLRGSTYCPKSLGASAMFIPGCVQSIGGAKDYFRGSNDEVGVRLEGDPVATRCGATPGDLRAHRVLGVLGVLGSLRSLSARSPRALRATTCSSCGYRPRT